MTRSIEDAIATAGLPPLPRTAWLEVDLDALASNLAVLREAAGPGVPIRPVVKGDAYGHGAVAVARALEARDVDGFCVATVDEAVQLREAGIATPILVLYPVPSAWAAVLVEERIAVTAGDEGSLRTLLAAADVAGAGRDRPLLVELEVESGLGRGGFAVDDIGRVAGLVATSSGARLAGCWTHLQAPANAARTAAQLARFDAASAAIEAAGVDLPARHATASTGLAAADIAAYDGVRPGLSVYGLIPDELDDGQVSAAAQAGLRPVLALRARPVRVADLPAGWGISYGPTFETTRPSRIATLPLGYGDGWPRSLSNRAEAIVRGAPVPLVGNVAMDAVMADVTDVPGAPVTTADVFTLIGTDGAESISVRDLARLRTTNSWEVVVTMARRLPRVYHAASGPIGLRTLLERG